MTKIRLSRRLTVSVILIVLLLAALSATTLALVFEYLESDVTITTGTVSVAMGDTEATAAEGNTTAVLDGASFLMEPGATHRAEIVVKNTGSGEAYFRVYLQNFGNFVALADATTLTVVRQDGAGRDAEELYSGPMSGLSRATAQASEKTLAAGETATVSLYFHMPADVGNASQNVSVTFDLCAEAVQTKNNQDASFGD